VSHVSFYRKYRPKAFEEVIGQERVTRTLQNAIAGGRTVHAYLFCGHRGTGKTTTARILAKALNCERGPTATPCNQCAICRAIDGGASLDVIEIDAASNRGIDEIRDLRERVKLMPVEGRHKVYIIDEAHMLTAEAANALLKTLEEPPGHAVFVLVTTEPHRLPSTITSRTQRFEFHRISQAAIVDRLRSVAASEGISADDAALQLIARNADGALRDAESVLDQLTAFCQGRVTREDVLAVLGLVEEEVAEQVTEAVIAGDAAACLALADRVITAGRDIRQIFRGLVEHFRDLLIVAVVGDAQEIVETSEDRLDVLRAQAARLSPGALLQKIRILTAAEAEARFATQARVVLEMALLKLCRPDMDPSIEGLAARLETLEARAGRSEHPVAEPTRAPAGRSPEPPTAGASAGEGPPDAPKSIVQAVGAASPSVEIVGRTATVAPPSVETASRTVAAAPPSVETAGRTVAAASHSGGKTVGPSEDDRAAPDIEMVRARWPRLREEGKQRSLQAHAFFLESGPRAVEGGELVLAVRHKFHLENLHEPKNRKVVEAALATVLGTPLRLRLVLGEAAVPGSTAQEEPGADALVEEAVRRFGNPVQEIRRLD
jgi:DNA polymerase III subunit gamma/tau